MHRSYELVRHYLNPVLIVFDTIDQGMFEVHIVQLTKIQYSVHSKHNKLQHIEKVPFQLDLSQLTKILLERSICAPAHPTLCMYWKVKYDETLKIKTGWPSRHTRLTSRKRCSVSSARSWLGIIKSFLNRENFRPELLRWKQIPLPFLSKNDDPAFTFSASRDLDIVGS